MDQDTQEGRFLGAGGSEKSYSKSRPTALIIGIALVALYVLTLILQANSGTTRDVNENVKPSDGTALVYLQLNGIDTERRMASFNVLALQYSDNDTGRELDRSLTLRIDPSMGSSNFTIPAGQTSANELLRLSMEGDAKLWPFDRYIQPVVISATSRSENVDTPLKVQVQVVGYSPGWKLANDTLNLDELDSRDQAFVGHLDSNTSLNKISLARSGNILLLSTLLVLVMVSLPAMGLFVAFRVWSGKQQFQPAFTAWFSAMLFAIIPIRNFLPGNPPIGAWVDTAVTVWAVIGLIAALLVYIRAWLSADHQRSYTPPPSRNTGKKFSAVPTPSVRSDRQE